jgi:hypothetical protein
MGVNIWVMFREISMANLVRCPYSMIMGKNPDRNKPAVAEKIWHESQKAKRLSDGYLKLTWRAASL